MSIHVIHIPERPFAQSIINLIVFYDENHPLLKVRLEDGAGSIESHKNYNFLHYCYSLIQLHVFHLYTITFFLGSFQS